MSAPDRLWDADVVYRLVDVRGGRARFQVYADVAPVSLAVHCGTLSWRDPATGSRVTATEGQNVQIGTGLRASFEAADAVFEYFAHPRARQLSVEHVPLAERMAG